MRWRNGYLKRIGFLNEIDNPLIESTQEQIQKILIEDTENVNPIEFIGEEDESKMKIISLRELSTELKGDKYYK